MKTIKEFLRYYNSRVREGLLPKSNDLETYIISKHITVNTSGSITTKETKIIIDTKKSLPEQNYNVHIKLENLKEGVLRKILKRLIIKNSNGILFNNCELTDNMIADLNKIKNIHDIIIYNCNSLKSVSGMKNDGWVEIYNCSSLKSISDMNNDGSVKIEDCSSLESVSNMNNDGGVKIYNCNSLKSISGVDEKKLEINNCPNYKK